MTLRVSKTFPAACGLMLVLAGCAREPAEDSSVADSAANRLKVVSLVKPQVRPLRRTTTQPAVVRAWQQAEIHAKVSGYLQELKVDIGYEITKPGESLAVISVPEMLKVRDSRAAEVKRLEAIEKRHVAEQQLAAANKRAAVAASNQAAAQVKQAEAQLLADGRELTRVKGLVADYSVERKLLDESQKRYDAAKAAKTAAEAAAAFAKAKIEVADAKIEVAKQVALAAKEETNVASKKLEETRELMKYATLTAPFVGIITERNVDVGDLVRNIQTASAKPRQPLFVVADLKEVRVHVMVPENDAALVRVGADVQLRLRSLSGSPLPGKVTRLSNQLDQQTRTMLVEVVLKNKRIGKSWKMLPGAYGEATITLQQKKQAIVLPAEAVRFDNKGNSTVYVLDANDIVQIVAVKTGIDFGDEIEITSGLNPDARVVGPVVGRLKADQKVRVR